MATEDPETGEPYSGNDIGWIDPRAKDADGEVLPIAPAGLVPAVAAWIRASTMALSSAMKHLWAHHMSLKG